MGNLQTKANSSLKEYMYEEIIDERMEILSEIFECDIASVIMLYLNAIHTMLSQTFTIEIRWSIARFQHDNINSSNMACKICFNRTKDILLKNDIQTNRRRLPFECIVEVSGFAENDILFEHYQCIATISSVFVHKNVRLNIETTKSSNMHLKKLQNKIGLKIDTTNLHECIVITFNKFKPDIIKWKNKQLFRKNWKHKYIVTNTALSKYLETKQYGPLLYTKDAKYCNIIFTDNCRI